MPESLAPSEHIDPRAVRETATMTALTVIAGAVDAITFLTMGNVFAALATGNVLFLAFAIVGDSHVPVARPAVALISFAGGVVAASLLTRKLVAQGRQWLSAAMAGEAVLLAAGGTMAIVRHGTGSLTHSPDLGVLAFVAVAMGMRAAAVVRAEVPGMPTLLVQMSLVNLLADVAARVRVPPGRQAALRWLARTRLTATVAGMALGGVLGASMMPWGTGRALIAVAAAVMALSGLHYVKPRHGQSGDPEPAS